MSLTSVPAAIMASIAGAVAVFHLGLYLRLRGSRVHLSFAILCLAVTAYDLFCVGLYNARGSAEGVSWQWLQSLAMCAGGIALLVFTDDYCGRRSGWSRRALAGGFMAAATLGLAFPRLLWTDAPMVKQVRVPLGGLVTYFERAPGPLNAVVGLLALLLLVAVMTSAVRCARDGRHRGGTAFVVSMGVFFLGVVNDSAVAIGLYQFVYTIEYAFMALVALMAWTLVEEQLRAGETRAALEQSQTRFRALADNVPGIIYLCRNDPRWTALYLNDAVESLTGYAKAELLADRVCLAELLHPDDRDRLQAGVAAAIARRQPYQVVCRLRHHRGDWRWVESVGVAVEQGGELLLEGFLADITARKRAEEALAASEERYRQLVEASPSGIVLVDPDGRIRFANPAAVAFLGARSFDDLHGRRLHELVPVENHPRLERRLRVALEGGPLATVEEQLVRLDGETLHVAVTGVGVVHDGAPAVLVVGSDVTARARAEAERSRLEGQLLHAQKLEAVGRLAGGVAHDFNNLLQAMLSQAETLAAVVDDPDQVREGLVELKERARRGAHLTRQLLLFSRRDSACRELLDLDRVALATAQLSKRLLREDIELVLEPAAVPLPVEGDRGQLEQVVMNLLLNAADAMPSGGRLRLATGGGRGQVWLEVSDSGYGIEPELQARIFEPFFTTKAPGEGSGLGLSVVHGIVTAHGGEVEVASKPGAGATFRVSLPRAPEAAVAVMPPAPATDPVPRGRGERILVVEDEADTRDALLTILDALGYSATGAASIAEARSLPSAPPFAGLLTDFLLPDGRGHELASELEARWPGLGVILMSGYTQDATVRADVAAGELSFLQKPFDMATLAGRLREVLDGQSCGAPEEKTASAQRRAPT